MFSSGNRRAEVAQSLHVRAPTSSHLVWLVVAESKLSPETQRTTWQQHQDVRLVPRLRVGWESCLYSSFYFKRASLSNNTQNNTLCNQKILCRISKCVLKTSYTTTFQMPTLSPLPHKVQKTTGHALSELHRERRAIMSGPTHTQGHGVLERRCPETQGHNTIQEVGRL